MFVTLSPFWKEHNNPKQFLNVFVVDNVNGFTFHANTIEPFEQEWGFHPLKSF